jgi:hypothetical protein
MVSHLGHVVDTQTGEDSKFKTPSLRLRATTASLAIPMTKNAVMSRQDN